MVIIFLIKTLRGYCPLNFFWILFLLVCLLLCLFWSNEFRALHGRRTLTSTLARDWFSPFAKVSWSKVCSHTHNCLSKCAQGTPFLQTAGLSPCISQQRIKRGTNKAEPNICTGSEQKLANAVYEIPSHLLPLPANVDGTDQGRLSDSYSDIIIND